MKITTTTTAEAAVVVVFSQILCDDNLKLRNVCLYVVRSLRICPRTCGCPVCLHNLLHMHESWNGRHKMLMCNTHKTHIHTRVVKWREETNITRHIAQAVLLHSNFVLFDHYQLLDNANQHTHTSPFKMFARLDFLHFCNLFLLDWSSRAILYPDLFYCYYYYYFWDLLLLLLPPS